MCVCVLCQDSFESGCTDGFRPLRRERSHVLGDILAVPGDEHLRAGLKEQLDAFPRIGDQAGGCAGGLEHPRCR